MDAKNIPLFNKIRGYSTQDNVRFHVPGHKGSQVFLRECLPYYQQLLALDVTELSGLDDLHDPQGVIAEAQALAADTFFAEQTYFLVNGSTVGNLAMILATLSKGDSVLVPRNCHKSIFNGLMMAEAQVICLEPTICPTFAVPVGITAQQVEQALVYYPTIKAIILTYPNYYGMASALQEIIGLAHQYDILVLVDEAHGAHFGQYRDLPPSAMQLGADISVQSTHKMLTSLTMTSMLHLQGQRVDKERLGFYLQSLQSSSPSYPLLASLDIARAQLQEMEGKWEQSLAVYRELRNEIASIGSYTVTQEPVETDLSVREDPFKLIIQSSKLSGFQLQAELEKQHIYPELADPFNVLCTLPLIPNYAWNERLLDALRNIAEGKQGQESLVKKKNFFSQRLYPNQDKPDTIQMKVLLNQEKEELTLEEASGRRIAEMIIPYPPGIPILIPGEEIRIEHIEYLHFLKREGAYFQGKSKLDTIMVLK